MTYQFDSHPSLITQHELDILSEAKRANRWWFDAVIRCAAIMVPRRKKYSGDYHPYHNFFDLAKRTGRSLLDVFMFYINIKLSRLATTQVNFDDESVQDTLADAANYALIALGAELDEMISEDDWTPPDPNAVLYSWPIVCVDYDGVLNKYSGWKGAFNNDAPVREGAAEFLKCLKERGFTVVVLTAHVDIKGVWEWMGKNDLVCDDVTSIKPPAVAYIDDRALCFRGDYTAILDELKDFKPFWQEK